MKHMPPAQLRDCPGSTWCAARPASEMPKTPLPAESSGNCSRCVPSISTPAISAISLIFQRGEVVPPWPHTTKRGTRFPNRDTLIPVSGAHMVLFCFPPVPLLRLIPPWVFPLVLFFSKEVLQSTPGVSGATFHSYTAPCPSRIHDSSELVPCLRVTQVLKKEMSSYE